MTADEELGNFYLPVSTVSHDYYGGERPRRQSVQRVGRMS